MLNVNPFVILPRKLLIGHFKHIRNPPNYPRFGIPLSTWITAPYIVPYLDIYLSHVFVRVELFESYLFPAHN